MAIRIGAVDPDYYQRQQESQRRSLYGLMEAMNAYEEKRRKKAEHELQAGLQTPGWVDSEMGRDWYSKRGQEYPELARYFDAEAGVARVRRDFLGTASKARGQYADQAEMAASLGGAADMAAYSPIPMGADALSGMAASAQRGMLSADPTGFRTAFESTPPELQPFVLEEAKAMGIPMSSIFPEQLGYDDVTDQMAAVLYGVRGGLLDPSDFQSTARIQAGIMPSPGTMQEKTWAENEELRTAKDLEGVKQENKLAEIKAKADAKGGGKAAGPKASELKFEKANIVDILVSSAPTREPKVDKWGEVDKADEKKITAENNEIKRWANGIASSIILNRDAVGDIMDSLIEDIQAAASGTPEDRKKAAESLAALIASRKGKSGG